MSAISGYLNQIINAVYGREVRQAIHDAIAECYNNVNDPSLKSEFVDAAVNAAITEALANGTIVTAVLQDGGVSDILNSKENEPDWVEAIIPASGWQNGVYSFENTYPWSRYDLEIQLNYTTTIEQYTAASKAGFVMGSNQKNTLKCLGRVPEVDIPIMLRVVTK